MKKCIVYGNCHVWPIRKYLMSSASFNAKYEIIHLPPVHQLNVDTGVDENLLYECDLFIYQIVRDSFGPLLSTDYILSKLPDSCTRISFGNAYFSGYYPQFASVPNFPYADKNVIQMIAEGRTKEHILSTLSDEHYYSYDEVAAVVEESLNELRKRDEGIDIPIAQFIEKYYRDFRLFYTYNHPTYHVCRYLAMNMLTKLGLPSEEIVNVVWNDDFSDHVHPIYPSVIKQLNLSFIHAGDTFNFGNNPHSFEQYTEIFILHLVR